MLKSSVALLLLLTACGRAQGPARYGRINFYPCGEAKCGAYEVFEDRAAKSGRKISLNIVLIPAQNEKPAPDPVFWLEGGPGVAAARSAGPVSQNYLRALRADHDFVFVDQRGTGQSNLLQCDDIGENTGHLDRFFGPLFPLDLIRACRDKLAKVADLKLYTTSIAADDLDEVRDALGYKQINLAGASYGTLAAQVYIREYPDRVRSAFLLGVATPDFRLPLPFARAAQGALDFLFQDCAADRDCQSTFPNLKSEFSAVLARFDRGPLKVTVVDPVTEKERIVALERENYVEHIRRMLYTTGSARFVPVVVHRAFLNDFVPFGVAAMRFNPGGPGLARGMYFTVTCAESAPFITEQEIVDSTRGTFLGDRRVRAHLAACSEWPRGSVAEKFTDPIKSDVPVIMFSGEADGVTPPSFAATAIKFWPNGRQILAHHIGHQLDSPCTWNLMSAFLRTGSARELDASCVESAHRPPFATELEP